MRFLWLAILVLVVIGVVDANGRTRLQKKKQRKAMATCDTDLLRLPDILHPSHYELAIETDLERLQFEGFVQIEVNIEQPGGSDGLLGENQIAIHVDREMEVDGIWYRDLGESGKGESESESNNVRGEYVDVVGLCRQEKHHIIIISLERDLLPGTRGQLHLAFARALRKDLLGYYSSLYKLPNGELKHMSVTQFETDHARSAFPCFDEPAYKATFNLTLIHAADRLALANTDFLSEPKALPAERGKHGGAPRKMTRFQKTPLMSTYLLAFVVGEFDYLEQMVGPVRLRTYTPVGKKHLGQLALDIAVKTLPLLEDYFGIPFPLKKLDLVSVPDFDAGAMENWGLITFRETAILVDEEHTSQEVRNIVIQTVIHELGHQWFGNLVTMDWWNDLWLNEAFASWVEYNMTATLYPELDYEYVFLLEAYSSAHTHDLATDTTPVAFEELEDSSKVDALMGPIIYDKGVSLVTQLNNDYLGPHEFRSALRHYMGAHAYDNTKASDLWHSMELNSRLPVRQFMENWLLQPGHPVVSVELEADDSDHQWLRLSQKRLLASGNELDEEQSAQRWIIPIRVLVADDKSGQRELLEATMTGEEETEESVKLPDWFKAQKGQWLKLNANSTGMFVVYYSQDLLDLMLPAVKSKSMPPKDRLNLLIELGMLKASEMITSQELETVLRWFRQEDHWAVLEALQRTFNEIPYSKKQARLNDQLFMRVFKEMGQFTSTGKESFLEERARNIILLNLVHHGREAPIKAALEAFDQWANKKRQVHPFLRQAIYLAVVSKGSEAQFEWLLKMAHEADIREERERIVCALAKADNSKKLERVWRMVEEPSFKIDDKIDVLDRMLETQAGCKMVKELLTKQRSRLVELNRGKPVDDFEEYSKNLCLQKN